MMESDEEPECCEEYHQFENLEILKEERYVLFDSIRQLYQEIVDFSRNKILFNNLTEDRFFEWIIKNNIELHDNLIALSNEINYVESELF